MYKFENDIRSELDLLYGILDKLADRPDSEEEIERFLAYLVELNCSCVLGESDEVFADALKHYGLTPFENTLCAIRRDSLNPRAVLEQLKTAAVEAIHSAPGNKVIHALILETVTTAMYSISDERQIEGLKPLAELSKEQIWRAAYYSKPSGQPVSPQQTSEALQDERVGERVQNVVDLGLICSPE